MTHHTVKNILHQMTQLVFELIQLNLYSDWSLERHVFITLCFVGDIYFLPLKDNNNNG